MNKLTLDYAKEHLDYFPETGLFFWKKLPNKLNNPKLASIGGQAGTGHHSGYVFITLLGKKVAAHRLAWAWNNEDLPGQLDHINGNRSDNRLNNLRPATRSQNMHNAKLKTVNKSGHKNVQWDSEFQKWRVRVRVDGRRFHIGRFTDKEMAIKAANDFMLANHKEFARIA
jgi:hypothetical protein